MKKEKIYVESNTLGVAKTTIIGYLTKIHPHLVNCTQLNQLLQTALEDVMIDANLVVDLNPTLKTPSNRGDDEW